MFYTVVKCIVFVRLVVQRFGLNHGRQWSNCKKCFFLWHQQNTLLFWPISCISWHQNLLESFPCFCDWIQIINNCFCCLCMTITGFFSLHHVFSHVLCSLFRIQNQLDICICTKNKNLFWNGCVQWFRMWLKVKPVVTPACLFLFWIKPAPLGNSLVFSILIKMSLPP